MLSNINANPTHGHLHDLKHLRNAHKTVSGLTNRETEVLNQIRDKVSAALGVPVMINKGEQSDCGQFNMAFTGVVGVSATGPRQPFLITPNMLTQMAEDENKFHHFMAKIQEQIETAIMRENQFRNNHAQAEQDDSERRGQQIRNSIMLMTDFWNVDPQASQKQSSQTPEQVAGRYEQMLTASDD